MTDRAVFFDGQELPWHIAEGGVHFRYGGRDDLHRLTIEFFVESATFLGIDQEAPWVVVQESAWLTAHNSKWKTLEAVIKLDYWVELGWIKHLMGELN
ncbi:hypothetical protein H7I96_03430 [Mycolicibacterium aichiense]|nr:hypothetical protein [Mycolicibacterium aichiense]